MRNSFQLVSKHVAWRDHSVQLVTRNAGYWRAASGVGFFTVNAVGESIMEEVKADKA